MSLVHNMLASAKACAAPSVNPSKVMMAANLQRIDTLIKSIIIGELPTGNVRNAEGEIVPSFEDAQAFRARIEGYAETLRQEIYS